MLEIGSKSENVEMQTSIKRENVYDYTSQNTTE